MISRFYITQLNQACAMRFEPIVPLYIQNALTLEIPKGWICPLVFFQFSLEYFGKN